MGYLESNFQPEEEVKYKARLHFFLFVQPITLFILAVVLIVSCNGKPRKKQNVKEQFTKTAGTIESYPFQDSISEVLSYRQRMTLKRTANVPVIYPDVYKIETQQAIYSPDTKEIVLNVINLDAISATDLGEYLIEQWDGKRWNSFPFIDDLAIVGVGRSLSKGDTIPEVIPMWQFKEPLKPNRYKIRFYVFLNIFTSFSLTENSIQSTIDTEQVNAPWDFRVLESTSDSIRMVFRNFTNLEIQPVFFPSVEEPDTRYSVHPLARSGWSGEYEWMQKYALLKEGEAILISVPTSWNNNIINDPNMRKQYSAGKMASGNYNLGLQLRVYMNTEFEVK